MSCNPCCCWRLKDAAVTIGIWSCIYALASLAMYAWQWGVLSQCQHVTMAQSNLQCEYYCPCVGASTARTSALIEALFVIQILCLIVAFFYLFASVGLIYGVHTWSRYLLWPWFVCTLCSILTSLAYCITWWSGDVRDYWLVLTILQFFAVIVNSYLFVVVWVFFKRMDDQLNYYEGQKQKYNNYNQRQTPNMHEVDNGDDFDGYPQQQWDQGYPEDKFGQNYHWDNRLPKERFDNIPVDNDDGFVEGRPRSVPPFQTPYDDFSDVPRQHHRSRRRRCSHCDHKRRHKSHKHKRKSRSRHKDDSCSTCSTDITGTEDTVSTHPAGRRHRHHRRSRSRHDCRECTTAKSQRSAVVQVDPDAFSHLSMPDQSSQPSQPTFNPNSGFSIPQHIVIPPETNADPTQPRKYQINSEITIAYDPNQGTLPRPSSRYPGEGQPISYTSNV